MRQGHLTRRAQLLAQLAIALLLTAASSALPAAESQVATLIRSHVEGVAATAGGQPYEAALVSFYRKRDYRPAWSSVRSVQNLARSLSDLTLDGLAPEDYHLGMLRQAPRANVIAAERAVLWPGPAAAPGPRA